MIRALVVTVFPVLFLILLFGGGSLLRKRNIDMDGAPPIGRTIFLTSKYLIMVIWAMVVLHAWGIKVSFFEVPEFVKGVALALWIAGFLILFTGRFNMGDSFRIGAPRESTGLKVDGLFRFSRNPMYIGVFTTLLAAVLHTLNPAILLIVIFIIAIHHKIVLAEEEYLLKSFGDEYQSYRQKVRRYI